MHPGPKNIAMFISYMREQITEETTAGKSKLGNDFVPHTSAILKINPKISWLPLQ